MAMRMPRVRFTVRRMMVVVAVTGWLVGTAARTMDRNPFIFHAGMLGNPGRLIAWCHQDDGNFWARYSHALLSRPWNGTNMCHCRHGSEKRFGGKLVIVASSSDYRKINTLI